MKRFSLIICAVFALSCSQQREDEGIPANFAAPTQAEESKAESEEADAVDEEVSAEPAPAQAPAAEPVPVEDSARERSSEAPKTAPKRSARPSAAPSGCPDQTCFEKCKPFGSAQQSECAQAYSRGCFSPERDPLNCGEFGVGEAQKGGAPADENVGEMPVPRLD
ncbi:hypothetical protein FRD01_06545 [Microvenator marinus]|jgi:hypothetical protein|uniref:Uncharacterized protein n=1 Tax=Microvenator marinus TaxID=2600177 RepID=A0A5B8XMZ8_9DELT|nr:hypothetical protein [Microvenator marinus]QED26905.1 hypothetical protein FRD01_06545 [Microvenator marinus]